MSFTKSKAPASEEVVTCSSYEQMESGEAASQHNDRQPNRQREFWVSVGINFISFLLPVVYATISKLWIGHIDSSQIATTDVWGYIGVIAEVFNEGLPRAAWATIANDSPSQTLQYRLSLAYTMILFEAIVGLIISGTFVGAAGTFAQGFVPEQKRASSLKYIRISAFSAFTSAVGTAIANSTRSLDKPAIPLIIETVRIVLNIILDLLLISTFHVGDHKPTINDAAIIRLSCELVATAVGFLYFAWKMKSVLTTEDKTVGDARPSWKALRALFLPGLYAFCESAVRKSIFLWLISTVTAVSLDYANGWSVYTLAAWGFINVPILTLEASCLAHIGHAWGDWQEKISTSSPQENAHSLVDKRPWKEVRKIVKPAMYAVLLVLIIEIPLCLLFSFLGITPFARWLGTSEAAVNVTAHMWRTTGWCYIFYAVTVQLSAVLLATAPKWFMYATLVSVLLYQLPWAIVLQLMDLSQDRAWKYHGLVFGGTLIFGLAVNIVFDGVWVWRKAIIPSFGRPTFL